MGKRKAERFFEEGDDLGDRAVFAFYTVCNWIVCSKEKIL